MPYKYSVAQEVVPAKQATQAVADRIVIDSNPTDDEGNAMPPRLSIRYQLQDADGRMVERKNANFTFGVGQDVDPDLVIIPRAATANVTAIDVYRALQAFAYTDFALGRAGIPVGGSIT